MTNDSFDPTVTTKHAAHLLLAALLPLASRSKHRQVDLGAAIAKAGLRLNPEKVQLALDDLLETGMLSQIIPLFDGGVLVSVTNVGMDQLRTVSPWSFLDRKPQR